MTKKDFAQLDNILIQTTIYENEPYYIINIDFRNKIILDTDNMITLKNLLKTISITENNTQYRQYDKTI